MNAKLSAAALALVLMSLGACAPLTADAPLFTAVDQIGPPPLQEGHWVFIDDDCPRSTIVRHRRLPDDCHPFELRRSEDGAWRLTATGRDKNGEMQTVDVRIVIAPALEHATPETFQPLYLAEYSDPEHPQSRTAYYAAIAPIGALPATEAFVLAQIDCTAILREGPIEGVAEQRDAEGKLSGCAASSQASVREAARRAVIQGLGGMDQQRMLFVRP